MFKKRKKIVLKTLSYYTTLFSDSESRKKAFM